MKFLHPKHWSLSQKLTGTALLIGAGGIALMQWYSVTQGTKALLVQQALALEAARTSRAHYIETYFDIIQEQMRSFARSNVTIEAIEELTHAFHLVEQQEAADLETVNASLKTFYEEEFRPRTKPVYPTWRGHEHYLPPSLSARILQAKYISDNVYTVGEKRNLYAAPGQAKYHRIHNRFHPLAREFIESFGYYDIFLFDPSGNLIYSVAKESDFATNFLTGPFRDSNLAQAIVQALESKDETRVVIVDFARYEPSYGAPAIFIATPVFSYGRRLGAAAIQLPIDRMNEIMGDLSGLGETGDTFLVGPDKLMRSQSRFDDRSSVLESLVETPAVAKAFAGESGTIVETGHRGRAVLASFGPIRFSGVQWAMIAEIDMDEVIAPAIALRNHIIVVGFGLVVLAMLGWALLTRRWLINPINALVRATERVRRGDYTGRVNVTSTDEIGYLGDAFNHMSASISDDIGRREAAEATLAQETAVLEATLENMDQGIFMIDPELRLIAYNRRACELLDLPDEFLATRPTSEEIVRRQIDDGEFPDEQGDRQEQVRQWMAPLKTRTAAHAYERRRPNGIVLEVHNNPLPEGGWVRTFTDITKRKALEEEMVGAREAADTANRAKSEFLSNMSHELRTPLNGVLGYVQILEKDRSLSEQQRESLAAIDNCGKHLLALINNVLDLSRIESGHLEIDIGPCDLPAVLKSVQDIVRPRAETKGLELHWNVALEIPRGIVSDRAKLQQVLVNILGNAIKFTDKGAVTLDVTSSKSGELRFAVQDTGIGMTQEELAVIFDAFKQVEGGKAAGGTGLGLNISRRLTEALDGSLEVSSDVGVGTTFTLTLPLVEAELHDEKGFEDGTLADAEEVVLAPGQSVSVLIADDRAANRDILKRLLHQAGFSTTEAKDGVEALERMEEQDFPLVLMDIRMPGMDGVEAIWRIRENAKLRQAVVIAVSASVFPDSATRFESAGFDDFMAKPLRAGELFDKIARHLDVELIRTAIGQTPEARSNSQPDIAPELARNVAARLREAAEIGDISAINEIAVMLQSDVSASSYGEAIDRLAKSLDLDGVTQLADDLADIAPGN